MLPKVLAWIKANVIPSAVAAGLLLTSGTAVIWTHSKAQHATRDLTSQVQKMQKELSEIKQAKSELEVDRNNVLEQTRSLLQEKSKWADLQEQFDTLSKNYATVMSQKDRLLQDNQNLRREMKSALGHFDKLKDAFQSMDALKQQLDAENKQLKASLANKVESAPQFVALSNEARNLKRDNEKLTATVNGLNDKLKKASDYFKKTKDRDQKFAKQIEVNRQAMAALKTQNATLVDTNQKLNKTVDIAPQKFQEMAQQNKALIKETAEMHYNMGVFFTQNRNFERAVREFKRALEIDPNNAKAYYNLGYLYAEEYEKHEEAMALFKHYLEINPNAPEADALRSYMVVRQTYGDKIAKK